MKTHLTNKIISIIAFAAIMLFAMNANAVVKTWQNGAAGGLWTDGTKWSGGTAPLANDDIVINPSASIVITAVPSIIVRSITIGGTGDVTLTGASGAIALQINGPTLTNNLVVSAGATLQITGTGTSLTLNFNSTANQRGLIDGTLKINALGVFNTSGIATTVVTVSSTGAITNSGGTVTSTVASTLVLSSGATYNQAMNGGSIPSATWDASSLLNVTGVVATMPSGFSGGNYGNLTWNCTGQTGSGALTANGTIVKGNLSILAGKISLATYNISVAKIVTVTSPGTLESQGATSYLIMNGTAGQTISGNGNFTVNSIAGRIGALNINNSGSGVDLQNSLSLVSNLILTNGNLFSSNGSTLTIGVAATNVAMTRLNGSVSLTTAFGYTTGAYTVTYGDGTARPAITTGVEIPYTPTTITGSFYANNSTNGVYLSGSISISNNATLYLSSGPLYIGANTLNLTGTISPTTGNMVGGANSDINYYPGASVVSGRLYPVTNGIRNLTINRPGFSVLLWSGDAVVNGVLTLTAGQLVLDEAGLNPHTLTLNGTVVSAGGLLCSTNSGMATTLNINGSGDLGTFGFAWINSGYWLGTLNMNRSTNGKASLNTPLTIRTTLNLADGLLFLRNGDLTMNATTGVITGGASNSYIATRGSGRLVQTVLANKNYPIGDSSNYMPISFSCASSTVFSIRIKNASVGVPADAIVPVWEIQSAAQPRTISPTLSWTAALNPGGQDPLSIYRYNGVWTDLNIIPSPKSPTSGTFSNINITVTSANEYTPRVNPTCVSPAITTDPIPAIVCDDGNTSFSITATGSAPLSYQWQEDAGAGFYNLSNGGVYSGVFTNSLVLSNVPVTMSGYTYRCYVTGGCLPDAISNSALLTVNPLPSVFNVTGGGSYCAEETAVSVGLDGSASGINYQLLYEGSSLWSAIGGTGSAIDFGLQTQAGAYTVLATNATTGCQNMMTGSAAVSIYNCPTSRKSVAINTTGSAADSCAMLDISDYQSGILLPRMDDAARDNIISPATGLLIYNTSTNKINYYNGSWYAINSAISSMITSSTAINYGVAVNTTGALPTNSAMLDVSSTTKGVLFPRTLPGAIYGATEGCIIFNIYTGKFNYYNGGSWAELNGTQVSVASGSGSANTDGCAINLTNALPAASAILDVAAQNKAVLIPRLTEAQKEALLPVNGLMIYNKTSKIIEYWNGTGWYRLQ